MYLCIYVCIYIYISTYAYICIFLETFSITYMYDDIYTYVHMHTCMCKHTFVEGLSMYTTTSHIYGHKHFYIPFSHIYMNETEWMKSRKWQTERSVYIFTSIHATVYVCPCILALHLFTRAYIYVFLCFLHSHVHRRSRCIEIYRLNRKYRDT